ncbi:transcription factor bHLH68 isoform X2 [Amborella trichopoda]|uniref:transcription factor bHLH68 isoform X2 n=1 Tax=Amborella trichopoda TaxID=13333 RepID=UPI0009C0296E|nr:transcription factor bHLH68 isoform X2 [Amborella trichopoda]|eukprot:XP_020518276.1 transcription factor bHLH68 isoform X2 [Amborella trichopoda]
MNRLQSFPVQQIMTGNPNRWNINAGGEDERKTIFQGINGSSMAAPYPPLTSLLESQEFPESWSQLLSSDLAREEDRCNYNQFFGKKMDNFESQMLLSSSNSSLLNIKQENIENCYGFPRRNEDFQATKPSWPQNFPVNSSRSIVASFGNNILDFSSSKRDGGQKPNENISECNSTAVAGSSMKKPRVQTPSTQFKVRKEKLGDRITALHQLVSPFGKTDTASVLLEAIGYIRFLQEQIEVRGSQVRGGCRFPEDPGQLLNESSKKRRGANDQDAEDEPKDLRSRGLCLVPLSCTLPVSSDNGADYWAPTLGSGF